MIIDWKGLLGHLTGTSGWRLPIGTEEKWIDDQGNRATVHSEDDHFELWLDPPDEGSQRLLWQGTLESLSLEPTLGRFATALDAKKLAARTTHAPTDQESIEP